MWYIKLASIVTTDPNAQVFLSSTVSELDSSRNRSQITCSTAAKGNHTILNCSTTRSLAETMVSAVFVQCSIAAFSDSPLTFRHRASCILGQAFHYSPENAFYTFNQQIYFII